MSQMEGMIGAWQRQPSASHVRNAGVTLQTATRGAFRSIRTNAVRALPLVRRQR